MDHLGIPMQKDISQRRVTLAEMHQLGREDGEHIATAFEKLTEDHGDAIPESAMDAFCQWQHSQIVECEKRLRAAGMNTREIKAWRRGVKEKTKDRGDALVRAMTRKH